MWIDISQPLDSKIAHWEGDQPFQYSLSFTKQETGSVNIGHIATSTHNGTHVDAPFHFDDDGKRIIDMEIDRFIGDCCVINQSEEPYITADSLESCIPDETPRVLIKTRVPNDRMRFQSEIPFITPEAAALLHSKGVKLIGVDVPSVDDRTSKSLQGHHALHQFDIYILENLMLDHIETGHYEMIALPLPLIEADGSPVRAVIRRKVEVYE